MGERTPFLTLVFAATGESPSSLEIVEECRVGCHNEFADRFNIVGYVHGVYDPPRILC
jgi:hypothetical protein